MSGEIYGLSDLRSHTLLNGHPNNDRDRYRGLRYDTPAFSAFA
ncbi:hypothetical protein [Acaryochloris sp. IP29b_bin.148]|nr:hypothetical protein [Acaryochloris sp. IP29b_bin.148]